MGWVVVGLGALAAAGFLLAGMWSAERSQRRGSSRSDRWFVLRGYPLVIVLAGLGLLFVVPASVAYGEGDVDSVTLVALAAWAVTALLGGFGLVVLGRNLAGHDPVAGRIAERLSDDEPSRQLLTRWLQRVRWRRWLGGFLGVLLTLLLSGDSDGPDLLVLAFAGIMVGSLSAELHHWRRAPGPGARAADLTRRHLGDYTVAGEQWLVGLLATVAVAALGVETLGVDVAGGGTGGSGGGSAWPWAGAALGVAAAVLATQWRIVSRRRPALPVELRRADDLARRLAVSRGVAQPGMTLLLTLVGKSLSQLGLEAVGGISQVLAVGLWLGTRRLGLDKLLRGPAPAPRPPEPAASGPAPA